MSRVRAMAAGGGRHAQGSAAGLLAGGSLALLAAAWLPGQAHAGAVRFWILTAVLPWVVLRATRVDSSGGVPAAGSLQPRFAIRISGAPVAVGCWGGLACLSAASALWVPAPGAALRVALLQVGWAVAALLGAEVAAAMQADVTPRRVGSHLAGGVAAAGAIAAAPSLFRSGGTFGNPSILAGFVAPCLVFSLYFLQNRPWKAQLVFLAVVAAQVAGLAASGSLAGAVAGAAGLAAFAALPAAGQRRPGWLRAGVVVALGVGVSLLPGLAAHLEGRWHLLRMSWGVAVDALPWGTGAGQLMGAFLREQAAAIASGAAHPSHWTLADHAHNELIHALAEQGPVGAVLFAWPFAAALRASAPRAARAALVAALAVAAVSLPMYEPATAMLVGVLVGMCQGGAVRVVHIPRVAVAVAFTALSVLASADLLGDRILVSAAEAGNVEGLRRAAALSLRPEAALRASADRLLPTHPTRARMAAEQAVSRVPTPGAWLLVGRASLAAFEPRRAIDAFEAAVSLHPRLFAGWLDLAHARFAGGDPAGARKAGDRARELRPTDPRLSWLPR